MNLLFAAADTTEIVFFVVLPVIVMITITSITAMRNTQQRKLWEHDERMKAMALGHVLPTNQSSWARSAVCIAIGAVVPIGSFLFTWLATFRPDTANEIWIAPTLVSLLSVLSGSILAGNLFASTRKPSASDEAVPGNVKPAYDDDALDVVSTRG